MAMKCCTKVETAKERCPIVFQGHPSNFKVTRYKTSPILTQIGRFRTIGGSQLSNPSDLPCWLCSHHRIIMKFSGVITTDQGDVHAKGQGQRSKVKVTEVTTQLSRFQTVTPVWIHIWWWNDIYSLILLRRGALLFLAATKQLYKWYFPSVRLSVTPFWLCSHHRIMKFSGVITNDWRKVHAKGQGQRSKVKVTEVTTQLNRFRTVTPVWIHIWWWNDAYSLMLLRRGALLFFKVIRQISRSHGSKNRRLWPRLGVSGL